MVFIWLTFRVRNSHYFADSQRDQRKIFLSALVVVIWKYTAEWVWGIWAKHSRPNFCLILPCHVRKTKLISDYQVVSHLRPRDLLTKFENNFFFFSPVKCCARSIWSTKVLFSRSNWSCSPQLDFDFNLFIAHFVIIASAHFEDNSVLHSR